MMQKIKWLAVAKYGTEQQKEDLANNLRITPTPDGYRCPAWLALDNSVRGFYAEEVAMCYLNDRKAYTGRGYRWDDDGIVYEKDDIQGPHISAPDGMVVTKDGEELMFDVKANASPCRYTDIDGTEYMRFNRTHNADLILWHCPREHALYICRRESPKYHDYHIWDSATYRALGAADVADLEAIVDGMLQSLI